jgi:hypothetical protein
VYDSHRSTLNAVAFRGHNRTNAYHADSSPTSTDRKNVRDGHYVIQGPLHFFTALTDGQPSPLAKQVLEYLVGSVPIDPNDTANTSHVSTVAALGTVPQCAMMVQIDRDGGYFSPFTPAVSCTCRYERVVNGKELAGCVSCTSSSQCAVGKTCQTGYCE